MALPRAADLAKVNFDDATPTEHIVKKAKKYSQVKDVNGRLINFKDQLNPGEQIDMLIMIGSEAASIGAIIRMANVVMRILNIDGQVWVRPTTYAEFKQCANELNHEGFTAVYKYDNDRFDAELKAKEQEVTKQPESTDE